jgi:hypothetical protein
MTDRGTLQDNGTHLTRETAARDWRIPWAAAVRKTERTDVVRAEEGRGPRSRRSAWGGGAAAAESTRFEQEDSAGLVVKFLGWSAKPVFPGRRGKPAAAAEPERGTCRGLEAGFR